jgi:hypothetical protein
LLIYTTLFFIQVAYMKSHKTTKRPQYKPKSQRGKRWRYTTRLKTWAIQWGSQVADPISKWANSRKERQTIFERTKIARRMQKGNGKKIMAFLAFAAVAMQGTGGLKDNHTSFDTDSTRIRHQSVLITDALDAYCIELKTSKARYRKATGPLRELEEREQQT